MKAWTTCYFSQPNNKDRSVRTNVPGALVRKKNSEIDNKKEANGILL